MIEGLDAIVRALLFTGIAQATRDRELIGRVPGRLTKEGRAAAFIVIVVIDGDAGGQEGAHGASGRLLETGQDRHGHPGRDRHARRDRLNIGAELGAVTEFLIGEDILIEQEATDQPLQSGIRIGRGKPDFQRPLRDVLTGGLGQQVEVGEVGIDRRHGLKGATRGDDGQVSRPQVPVQLGRKALIDGRVVERLGGRVHRHVVDAVVDKEAGDAAIGPCRPRAQRTPEGRDRRRGRTIEYGHRRAAHLLRLGTVRDQTQGGFG